MATTIQLHPLPLAATAPINLSKRAYLQPANSKLVKKVTRASRVIFQEQELFSDIVGNDANMRSDSSWAIRGPTDLLPASTSLDVLNPAMRQTTAIPAAIGIWKAFKAGERAERIGDDAGRTISRIDKAASGTQLLFALNAIAGRVTALWAAFKPTPSVVAASSIIATIFSYLLIPLFLAFGISGAYGAKNAHRVYQEYLATNKSFGFLVNSLFLNERELQEILNSPDHLRTIGEQALQEKGDFQTLDAAIDALGLTSIEEYYMPKLTDENMDVALLIGLLIEIQKKQACKAAALERAIGGQSVAMIKKSAMKGLQTRLEQNETQAQQELAQIQAKIDASYTHIQRMNLGLAILSTITVILSIVFLLNPFSSVVMVSLATLTALAWIGYDIYSHTTFEGPPGKFDKHILLFSSIVTLIGSGISIGTAAVLGAPVTLAVSIALCIVLLSIYAYSYNKINRLEKKHKNPLDAFELHLQQLKDEDPVDETTHALFKKLSKFDRQRITDYAEQLPFKDRRFRQETFIKQLLLHFFHGIDQYNGIVDKQSEQHLLLIRRATKKAVKHYWTAYWYRSKDSTAKEHALQLQNFLRVLEGNDLRKAHEQYNLLKPEARAVLETHLTRVFKRDSSIGSLRQATQSSSIGNQTL